MEWASLLSTNKLGEEAVGPRDWANYPINAFEQDYNKIVSSAAFRRLQDKTQVFPLDKSDFSGHDLLTLLRCPQLPGSWVS